MFIRLRHYAYPSALLDQVWFNICSRDAFSLLIASSLILVHYHSPRLSPSVFVLYCNLVCLFFFFQFSFQEIVIISVASIRAHCL